MSLDLLPALEKNERENEDVILYNTKNDVSLPLISPRLIVFSLLSFSSFSVTFQKKCPGCHAAGFCCACFCKGIQGLEEAELPKGSHIRQIGCV